MRYLQPGRLQAVPLLFVTLLLILAACGNGGGGTIPSTNGAPKLAARQILTFPNVGVADSASLDPALVAEATDPNTSLIVSMIYTGLVKAGLPTWIAAYGDEASVDIIDKLVTVLVAIFIYQGLPRRYRSLFRMYEPADSEGEERAPARA